jgi:hypothetical protein
MSVTVSLGRRSRRVAALLATALALTTIAIAGPAQSATPPGSLVQLFTESPDFTADPANAIQQGWWGHEGGTGPAGSGPTYLSLASADFPSGQDLLTALGTDNFDDIGYAIVPYSADGSNERPSVTAGENAAEAFDWVVNGAAGWGAALNGSSASNDAVTIVSDLSQLTAWVAAGRPLQGFDDSLVLHDLGGGNPVSTAPKGTSILDAWPAGTELSLVAYVTNGFDADLQNEVPLVEADGTGHAKTAWMPFATVASPTSAIRTSAGYEVLGAYAPGLTITKSVVGTTGTLTATIKNNLNAVATDATGNVEFTPVVNGSPQLGSTTSVATTNGIAALSIPSLPQGTTKTYDVRYVPDAPAQATYLTTGYTRTTIVNAAVVTPPAPVQSTIAATLKPTKPKHGTRPKLTVNVTAPGVTVAGTVTIVFDPPKGKTKTLTGALAGGTVVVKLPKVVKGKTKLTISYPGTAQVLASSLAKKFKAT